LTHQAARGGRALRLVGVASLMKGQITACFLSENVAVTSVRTKGLGGGAWSGLRVTCMQMRVRISYHGLLGAAPCKAEHAPGAPSLCARAARCWGTRTWMLVHARTDAHQVLRPGSHTYEEMFRVRHLYQANCYGHADRGARAAPRRPRSTRCSARTASCRLSCGRRRATPRARCRSSQTSWPSRPPATSSRPATSRRSRRALG